MQNASNDKISRQLFSFRAFCNQCDWKYGILVWHSLSLISAFISVKKNFVIISFLFFKRIVLKYSWFPVIPLMKITICLCASWNGKLCFPLALLQWLLYSVWILFNFSRHLKILLSIVLWSFSWFSLHWWHKCICMSPWHFKHSRTLY